MIASVSKPTTPGLRGGNRIVSTGDGHANSGPTDSFTRFHKETDPARALRALASSRPHGQGQALDSAEYKLLLDPKCFANEANGVKGIWSRLESAASSAGLETEQTLDLDVKSRGLAYLDTPHHDLRKAGYILRERSDSRGAGNVVLKYRESDRNSAARGDVSVAEGFEPKSKFEKDVACQGHHDPVYSKSTKVKMKHLPHGALDEFSRVFPGLDHLGLSADATLKAVGGHHIQEDVHVLGDIHLSPKVVASAQLTLWHEGKKDPVVAELSFKMPGENAANERSAQTLMSRLKDQAGDWVSKGSNKTDWVYSGPQR